MIRWAWGLYLGVLLVMVFFNGLFFLPTKDTIYLHYVVFLVLRSLDATLRGLGFAYLWPDTPAINNTFLLPFLFVAMWGIVLFFEKLLEYGFRDGSGV